MLLANHNDMHIPRAYLEQVACHLNYIGIQQKYCVIKILYVANSEDHRIFKASITHRDFMQMSVILFNSLLKRYVGIVC